MGADGTEWHVGSIPPPVAGPPAYQVGDIWLNGDSGNLYTLTAPNTWTPSGNIHGEAGAQGATGPTGPAGVLGTMESSGAQCSTDMNPVPGTDTQVPGCTLTATVSGTTEKLLVLGAADLQWLSGAAASTTVSLYVDGVAWQPAGAASAPLIVNSTAVMNRATYHQNWLVEGLTAGSHTLTLAVSPHRHLDPAPDPHRVHRGPADRGGRTDGPDRTE